MTNAFNTSSNNPHKQVINSTLECRFHIIKTLNTAPVVA